MGNSSPAWVEPARSPPFLPAPGAPRGQPGADRAAGVPCGEAGRQGRSGLAKLHVVVPPLDCPPSKYAWFWGTATNKTKFLPRRAHLPGPACGSPPRSCTQHPNQWNVAATGQGPFIFLDQQRAGEERLLPGSGAEIHLEGPGSVSIQPPCSGFPILDHEALCSPLHPLPCPPQGAIPALVLL